MAALNYREIALYGRTVPYSGRVHRVIPRQLYQSSHPRSLLHTTANINRCNPKGVHCLYASKDGETAQAEFRFRPPPLDEHHFLAILRVRHLLDLTDRVSWPVFGLEERDFFEPFDLRAKRGVLPLHKIGMAIAQRQLVVIEGNQVPAFVTGIQFPSNAMHHAGKTGINLVVFKDAFEVPDLLEPMRQGDDLQPTIADKWP